MRWATKDVLPSLTHSNIKTEGDTKRSAHLTLCGVCSYSRRKRTIDTRSVESVVPPSKNRVRHHRRTSSRAPNSYFCYRAAWHGRRETGDTETQHQGQEGERGDEMDMLSISVLGLHKVHGRLQQLVAKRLLFVSVVMVMSVRSDGCLMAPARAEAAIVVPHNGRIPAGFHHRCPSSPRGCRGARSCDPKVAFKRFRRRERTKATCAVHGVNNAPLKNVVVTGANRGLGFAIADHMLDVGGYRVVLACRSQQEVR